LVINTDIRCDCMISLFKWHNHLNPGINKDAWPQEEEIKLIHAHQTYGNKITDLELRVVLSFSLLVKQN